MTAPHKQVPANSVRRALNVLGDQWIIVILRELFIGGCRYADIQRNTLAAHATLSRRLQQLVSDGIIVQHSANQKPHRYFLTESGRDLLAFILAMRNWQEVWQEAAGAVRPLRHNACGAITSYRLVCGACRAPLHYSGVQFMDGPGAALEPPAPQRHFRRGKDNSAGTAAAFQVPEICKDQRAAQVLNACYQGHLNFQTILDYLQLPPQVIASRLTLLQQLNFLQAQAAQSSKGYVLTQRALAFYPVMLALGAWSDRWLADDRGPPQTLIHRDCNQQIYPEVQCDHCKELVHYGDLHSL